MSDYEVHNATIGQFTGLKDKNGNDVWEGDLIRTFEGDIMVVEWDNGCLVTKCLKPAREGRINTIRNAYFCGEVIGNIHDNPEVLLRR